MLYSPVNKQAKSNRVRFMQLLLVSCALFLPAPLASGFGGEDLIQGKPWHHEDLTCRATAGDALCKATGQRANLYPGSGFDKEAAHAIAWHADYIDSYLYSPIWWSSAIESGNPISVLDRFKASRSNYWHLASLHFDDLNSTEEVEDTWVRYLSGTLIALEWAAENNDVDAAHNVLGVSLHAVQDFYSHSTWINAAARREHTYLQTPLSRREGLTISTGAYEQKHSAVQHGQYNFACTAYSGDLAPLQTSLRVLCSSAAPTANLEFCEKARECELSPRDTATVQIFGDETHVAVLSPPGIAMDTTWLSRIGGELRGLTGPEGVSKGASLPRRLLKQEAGSGLNQVDKAVTDRVRKKMLGDALKGVKLSPSAPAILSESLATANIDPRKNCDAIIAHGATCARESDYLFAETKHLAAVTSHQWLALVDQYMKARNPAFWDTVKTCKDASGKVVCHRVRGKPFSYAFPPKAITDAFENYSKFPFQFLTAGHDQPAARAASHGWYMRVSLQTSDVSGAGTDGDIYLKANGQSFLLDYLNARDPASSIRGSAFVYNDFEAGDHQVYTVGPFDRLPDTVTLVNDSASAAEVWSSFGASFERRLSSAWSTFVHIFRNDQDYVGPINKSLSRSDLDNVISRGGNFTGDPSYLVKPGLAVFRVNGGAEGVYDIKVGVSPTAWRGTEGKRLWKEYAFEFLEIDCIRESRVDGWTGTDEPYFFLALSAYGLQQPQTVRFGPYENIGVDDGDIRSISLNRRMQPVQLPPGASINLAGQVYEHDNERSSDRDDLFSRFTGSVNPDDLENYNQFLSEWGRTLGGDWKLHRLKIHAFRRGPNPEYGLVYDRVHNVWIDEESSQDFALDKARLRSLGVNLNGFTSLSYLGEPLTVRGTSPRVLAPVELSKPSGESK